MLKNQATDLVQKFYTLTKKTYLGNFIGVTEIMKSLQALIVCESNICSPGSYPLYLSDQCCWKCFIYLPTYVKPKKGQHSCTECPLDSLSNKNKTQSLPLIYQYIHLTLSSEQKLAVKILSALGSAYTLSFFNCVCIL